MKDLKPLPLPAIFNMSFGFFGIQFGWGLQMANMSAIYEFLGASESDIPILWLAAPLTGLLVQPIVGYYSDRTWMKTLGRRRPYFLAGAILASISLVAMPNSTALWMAASLLWILDASVNVSMEPFRAFVADLMPPKQRQVGFAMQSLLIGLGAVLSSSLPWLLTNLGFIDPSVAHTGIPWSVKLSFYIGAAVYIAAVVYTVVTTKEFPPEPGDSAHSTGKPSSFFTEIIHGIGAMPTVMRRLAVVQFFTWLGLFCMWIYFSPAIARAVFGGLPGSPEYQKGIEWGGLCFAVYNGVALDASLLLVALTEGGKFARNVMLWSAVTALVVVLMGEFYFSGTLRSIAFGIAIAAAVNILVLLVLRNAKHVPAKTIHRFGLLAAGLGLISTGIFKNPDLLLLSMIGVGIGWATILSMPYALLANAIPANQMGFYMGVFNFFIVLPQILAATLLGPAVQHLLGGHAIGAVMFGGASMLLAAIALSWVPAEHQNSA